MPLHRKEYELPMIIIGLEMTKIISVFVQKKFPQQRVHTYTASKKP